MAFFYTFVNNISYKLKMNWSLTMQEMSQNPDQETLEYVFNQTMLRIKDPEKSIDFYTKVLGMTILKKLDFPDFKFSLYFLAYLRDGDDPVPENNQDRFAYTLSQKAVLELTHNWGTENDEDFSHHDGNSDPRGFGHIGITVPDVYEACLLYTSPSPRDVEESRMPSSA